MTNKRKNIMLFLIIAVMVLGIAGQAALCTADAGPIVIKGGDETDGSEPDSQDAGAPSRDRSLQDGTLIYSMTPVYPEDFDEGTYETDAVSSSQFFKITGVKLTNEGGRLSAVIRISSTSYAYVYPGTRDEAASADKADWIKADETSGYGEFTIDVEALGKEMPLAAYSKKKKKWYDRDIAILTSGVPSESIHISQSGESGTITDTQGAAMKMIYIAFAIIIIGGILNHFIKKRFYE